MIEIKDGDILSAEAVELLKELNATLAAITGSSGARSFCLAEMWGRHLPFSICFLAGMPTACGAVRELSASAAKI